MEEKVCKKCGRVLPQDYKYKKCESCRSKGVDEIKKVGRGVSRIFGAIFHLPRIFRD